MNNLSKRSLQQKISKLSEPRALNGLHTIGVVGLTDYR